MLPMLDDARKQELVMRWREIEMKKGSIFEFLFLLAQFARCKRANPQRSIELSLPYECTLSSGHGWCIGASNYAKSESTTTCF